MIKNSIYLFILIIFFSINVHAQDNCASAVTLCAGSSVNRSTIGASVGGSDPALSCGDAVLNNNVWFTILAINNGSSTVTVNNINNNPGLDMEIYTGGCGTLASIGQCASGSSATGGTMSITFATISGTTYYVMVDGNAGNQEAFDIIATTPNDAIVARPDANFNANPSNGCIPLSSLLQPSATVLHGGSNITYEWKFDAGSYIPSAGADTTITFSTIGTTNVILRVCNLQCGCKTVSQEIVAQDLFPVISYLPPSSCIGSVITFNGAASILPDPPNVPPNITNWDWDFGDPLSGPSNTATGQSVNHTFVGAGPSFSVRLIVQGVCGPDTTFTTINLLPKPVVTATGPSQVCQGEDVNLSSSVSNVTMPVAYIWAGAGSYSCSSCASTIVTTLPVGGPYTITLNITDALGCMADTSVDVIVNDVPTVFAGGFITVCKSDSAQLNAAAAGGLAPYQYQWAPSAGLNNDTIFDPYTFNTNSTSYCVTVTDANGCTSTPDCVAISQYPQPTISASSANLCASQTPLSNTFTVMGSGAGTTYEWGTSPDYSVITGAAPDSSSITADFPPVAATYNFIAIVTDGVTGCIDTVPTSFSVTAGLSMSVTGRSQICIGDTDTLTVSGATTYVWSASPSYSFSDSTSAIQIVSPLANTVFTITGTMGTCTETITYNLTVSPKPVASVDTIPPFCGCATVTLNGVGSTAGMSYLWTSQNGSSIVAPTNIFTNATICGSDSITLLVTDVSTGCFSDSTIATTIRPNPNANVTVTPSLICNGVATLINLDGSGSDTGLVYNWTSNNPAAVITDTTAYSTTATVSSATVFYLTVSDTTGCDSTYSDTLQIYPPPSFTADVAFLCTSDPVLKSTLSVTGASPGSTYTWDTIPPCAVPSSASTDSQLFDFASCGAGVFNFTVSVNDAVTTCTTVLSQSITIVNGVTLVVSNDTAICEGGDAVLWASGANSYAWNTGDITDTVIVSGLTAAGSPYVFTVIGTVGSCTDTSTINVVVNPVPTTSAICCDSLVCENDPITQYSVGPPSANTYNWNVVGGVIVIGQGQDNVFINWNTVGLASITVVETTPLGCSGATQNMNVIIDPLPLAPIVTGPDTVCSDEIDTYFVNAIAGSTYYWTINGGNMVLGPTGSVNTFQWITPGIDSLTVYEESAAGCIGPYTAFNVKVNPRPGVVSVTGNTLVCDNIPEIYTINPNPGSVYTWNVLNDLQDTLNASNDTLTVNWGTSSSGTINIFETNSFGCNSDTGNISITISQHPVTLIVVDSASVCNNAPYQIVANSNTLNVRWYTDGAGSFNDTTIASVIYIPAPADTGYVHLTMVAKSPPCINDTARVVLYFSPSPIVSITGPLSPICYGTIDSLRATGGGTYLWTPGGIPFSVIGVRPLVTTTYTVAVTNSYNCTTLDSFTVNVIPPGIADAGNDVTVCITDSILLNGSQQNAGGVMWSTLGDGIFAPDSTSLSVRYIAGALDTVSNSVDIILTTTGACLNLSDTINVVIQHLPDINAGNDTTLLSKSTAGVSVPLHPIATNVFGQQWTSSGSGTFTPSDTTFNATYVPSEADFNLDSVIIIVTTIGSCASDVDTLIIDFAPIVIPNVFSPYPSSPGYNDFFVIKYLTPHCILKVWDRWGSLVYTSDYYQNDWDANGLKADVYYYLVISEDKKYRGWVQVMRGE